MKMLFAPPAAELSNTHPLNTQPSLVVFPDHDVPRKWI